MITSIPVMRISQLRNRIAHIIQWTKLKRMKWDGWVRRGYVVLNIVDFIFNYIFLM